MYVRKWTSDGLLVTTLASSLLLVGCFGDGLDSAGDQPEPQKQGDSFSGTLAAPESTTTTASAMSTASVSAQNVNCDNVPRGYVPLENADLFSVDGSGNESDSSIATTDACGEFSLNASPGDAETIRARAQGFRDIEVEVSQFDSQSTNRVASTIPDDWDYQIGSLQRQSDGRLGFTVTDSETNRSVIGIPQRAFSFNVKDASIDPTGVTVNSAANTTDAASILLIMDASGSMRANAYNDDVNEESFSRFHLARDAAHEFFEEKSSADEIGFLVFDGNTDFINKTWIDDNWSITDDSGNQVDYTYSDSGFTQDVSRLRFITDAFSPYSEVYQVPETSISWFFNAPEPPDYSAPDARRHQGTNPNLELLTHRWGGGTALFDSVIEGIDILKDRANERQIILTMGDGADGSSTAGVEDAFGAANDQGVTIYSVGLGVGDPDMNSAAGDLRDMAEETGGAYFGVDSRDLIGAFETIQTGILFQYLADLGADEPDAGDKVEVTLNYNGVTVSRTLNDE